MATETSKSEKLSDIDIAVQAIRLLLANKPWGVNAVQKSIGGGTARVTRVMTDLKERLADAGYQTMPEEMPEDVAQLFLKVWNKASDEGYAKIIGDEEQSASEIERLKLEVAGLREQLEAAAVAQSDSENYTIQLEEKNNQLDALLSQERQRVAAQEQQHREKVNSLESALSTKDQVNEATVSSLEVQLKQSQDALKQQAVDAAAREESLHAKHEQEIAKLEAKAGEQHNSQQDFYTKQIESVKADAREAVAGLTEANRALTAKLESLQDAYNEESKRNAALCMEVSTLKNWLGEAKERLFIIDMNKVNRESQEDD